MRIEAEVVVVCIRHQAHVYKDEAYITMECSTESI
jgi:hypothetical protein